MLQTILAMTCGQITFKESFSIICRPLNDPLVLKVTILWARDRLAVVGVNGIVRIAIEANVYSMVYVETCLQRP